MSKAHSASDQLVSPKDVLQAVMDLKAQGSRRVLEDLEQREPELCGYALEELS